MAGLHSAMQLTFQAQARPAVAAYHHAHRGCKTLDRTCFDQLVQDILNLQHGPSVVGVAFSMDTPGYLNIYPCIIALLLQKRNHINLDPQNQSWLGIQTALAELQVSMIICDQTFLHDNPLEIVSQMKLSIDVWLLSIKVEVTHNLKAALRIPEIAYVAQTSGTTGKRKSVFVSWNSISPNVNDYLSLFQVSSVLSVSPPTFDPFYLEILLAFLKSVPIHFMNTSLKLKPFQFSRIVTENQLSWVQMTPSLFHLVRDGPCFRGETTLNYVILGGEKCPSVFPQSSIDYFNAYGVTEMSCWQSLVRIDTNQTGRIWSEKLNLLSETSLTLNKHNEIVVSSGSRMCHVFPESGTELSHSLFVVNTGDQGLWSKDKSIQFEARSKDFIKIQGKRVALLEIERELETVLDIDVKCVQDEHDQQRVVGFHTSDLDISLLKQLPTFMVPGAFRQVTEFPVTLHGKLDKRRLLDMFRKRRCSPAVDLKLLWKKYTGIVPEKDSNFVLNGGDSIQAVQLLGEIEDSLDIPHVQTCLELLLNGQYEAFQQKLENLPGSIQPKKLLKNISTDIVTNTESPDKIFPCLGRGFCHLLANNILRVNGQRRSIWTVDLKKCIDATPLIVEFLSSSLLYIGSHSGLLAAIDFDSGEVRWMRDLGDRIESCAVLSIDGHFIFVGCYDGCMYAMNSHTGELGWTFKTNGMIKTTVSVGGNEIYFGSYDHHLYCLDSTTGVELWKYNICGSSILAQSVITDNAIICATLSGHLSRRDLVNGTEIWTVRLDGPIFSNPVQQDGFLYCATAKGRIYKVNGASGDHVWIFEAKAAIFSSLILRDKNLVFGTHGRGVLSVDSDSGQELWRVQHRDHVFATPCLTQDGQVLSLGVDGQFIVSQKGEVCREVDIGEDRSGGFFSSPLAYKGVLIVCSRDNRVHCLSI